MHNWRRYPSSKCYEIDENVRFGNWRYAVAPSDAAEKDRDMVHNYSPSCAQQPQKCFGKFTCCMTWCAQTCTFWAVSGLPIHSKIVIAVIAM